jgi:hypothetical protein
MITALIISIALNILLFGIICVMIYFAFKPDREEKQIKAELKATKKAAKDAAGKVKKDAKKVEAVTDGRGILFRRKRG